MATISTSPNPLEKVIEKLDECIISLQSIPNTGECSTVRWKIYKLIQAQQGDCNGALYKELRCSIHYGLIGENGNPVTLPCGHNYCINCISPILSDPYSDKRCPDCRSPIDITLEQLKPNIALKSIVTYLLPR